MKLTTILSIILINIKHRLLFLFGRVDLIVPYKILIQTTNDCNSRCDSCHIWKINKDKSLKEKEIQVAHYENLFKSYGKDLYWISLSGGEVTLDSSIHEVIELAHKHCKNLKMITFTTNGLLPDRALSIAETIKKCGLDHFITISLDGNEELHDRIRGIPGNYEKAFKTFKLLKSKGFYTHFGITISDENHNFIRDEYDSYSESIKAVTFVNSGGIYNTDNTISRNGLLASLGVILQKYKVSSLGDFWEKLYIQLSLKFVKEGQKRNIIPCSAGLSSLHISPYGEVSPCMFLQSYSNIKDEGFLDRLLDKNNSSKRLAPYRGECQKCWMNCYAPHSMMLSPFKTLFQAFKK
ncbi:radical SAM protein [Halobacteriovorax sp.]|uniref:radical SAM protein n=1 Tax=Halobacteriovorax sp. TaxID=2020862 RepID=UPI00356A1BDC